jgi:exodeoxyribonuclease V alpha subunit
MLVSEAVAEGHVCIDLADYAGKRLWADTENPGVEAPDLVRWIARLRESPLIGRAGEFRPLILGEHSRLYLARYWRYEAVLAESLAHLTAGSPDGIDLQRLRRDLDRLFDSNRTPPPDWQKVAAAVAVLKRFCVISGGPGTGKTSTVIRILAALQSQAKDKPLRIALAAPTGKAAMRMQETIRRAKAELPIEAEIKNILPETASTLHRLLGSRPESIRFRHDRQNPLSFDVVVVDEASMIDLALMAKLIEALPSRARLILLGDKDQLASVEAGAVFGDICAGQRWSPAFCGDIEQATGIRLAAAEEQFSRLGNTIVLLQHSFRFEFASGIGQLARVVNQGEVAKALELLKSRRFGDIGWHDNASRERLAEHIEQGYAAYFAAVRNGSDAAEALSLFNRFRVLTALREGPAGADGINRLIEERLRQEGLIRFNARWYTGRPVLIIRNDYTLGLFNGDIGIALPSGDELRVHFEDAGGCIRSFAASRLPEHETAYATTVHKSQGSEFEEILLVLPDQSSLVLSRPMLYTAITRAKRLVEIYGPQWVLEETIRKTPQRNSGLRDRLWSAGF